MKKYLIFTFGAFLMISGFVFAHPAHATVGYSYYRAITVTSSTSIASGTNLSFPMLFSGTYPWLEASTTGGGSGRIQNLTTAPNGSQEAADLIFTTSTPTASGSAWNCGTSLNFETESYTPSTGAINDWVNVPSLAANQVIYACYGSTAAIGDQSHPSSTWNSNYQLVYHLASPTSTLQTKDSTANGNNGTALLGVTTTTGQIDGGAYFYNEPYVGPGYLQVSSTITISAPFTIEEWAYPTSGGTQGLFGSRSPSDASFDAKFSGGGVHGDIGTGSSWITTNADASFTENLNTWYHIAYVVSTSSYIIYADGAQVGNGSLAGTALLSDSSHILSFAGHGVEPLTGSLDEPRVSNSTLSSSWILTEYNNQLNPSTFYAVGSEQASGGSSSPTISSFGASPTTVAMNGTSTLSWSVTGATSLSISPTIGTVTGTSTTTPALTTSTIYTLTATNANGTSTATTSVAVTGGGGGGTNISSLSTQHWAWNDEIGWMDFYDTLNVTVSSSNLIGYASSSAGYISLDCGTSPNGNICGTSDYGISNDGGGNLAGWAWNDLYGWISFCGNSSGGGSTWNGSKWVCPSSPTYKVVVNPSTGVFSGWAWNDTVGWISFNCSNTSNCGSPSQYDVVTSWTGTVASTTGTMGTLDSETFDTGVTSGAELNSVTWQGSAPSQTSVSFQFAVSSSTNGPWNFTGPDGTSATSYLGVARVPVVLSNYSSLSGRYFRYRVILTTDPTGTATPRVQGIVVNWSP